MSDNEDAVLNQVREVLDEYTESITEKIDASNKSLKEHINQVENNLGSRITKNTLEIGRCKGEIATLGKNGNGNRSTAVALLNTQGFKYVGVVLILLVVGMFAWNPGDIFKAFFQ